MAIGRINATLTGVQPGGLAKIVPTSVAVGSGSGSVDSNGNVSFSGVSTVSLNNCFSSSYDNYLIQLNVSSVSGSEVDVNCYLRSNGTNNTSNMNTERFFQYSSTITGQETGSTMNFGLMSSSYPTFPNYTINMRSPFLSRVTTFNSIGGYVTPSGVPRQFLFWGYTLDTASYDGMTLYPSSGTFGGTIRVYGYNQ